MGREPTSGGCHTCRLRHLKCDEAKPACERCQKSGQRCQGYGKILRVQSHGVVSGSAPGSSHMARISRPSSFPASSAVAEGGPSVSSRSSIDRPARSGQGGQSISVNRRRLRSRPPPGGQPARATISHQLDLMPFADNICFSYFFEAYSWINVHSILLQNTPLRQQLAEQSDELSYDSLRALTYGVFSRDHRVGSLRQSAANLYGRTIERLRLRLTLASKEELAALIKPVTILGSYSITVDDDLRFAHHTGLAAILQHCGPEYFRDPGLLPLFESCRTTLIGHATVQRQGTFLEHEEWKTIPWSLSPDSKTSSSKLLDILASLPRVIEGVDEAVVEHLQHIASGESTVAPSTLPDLQHRTEKIAGSLALWYQEWELENATLVPQILHWAVSGTGADVNADASLATGVYDPRFKADAGTPESTFSFPSLPGQHSQPEVRAYSVMQDAAWYMTGLIWVARLHRVLTALSSTPDPTDPYAHPLVLSRYQTFPQPSSHVKRVISWNAHTVRICESPVRFQAEAGPGVEGQQDDNTSASQREAPAAHTSASAEPPLEQDSTLLPTDPRFFAQLRILQWLVEHLPVSRAYVLGTLAAMGLGHCMYDVRPTDGIEAIAKEIRGCMTQSRFEGATDVLLRNYDQD